MKVACVSFVEVAPQRSDRYKWIALSNTTLAVLLATLDASITIIAMPDIFRGIKLNPLTPGNSFYLLWMVLGYLIVASVLIVSLGRLGDMFGRVRIYNLGFVVYTVASLLLAIDWLTGSAGALYLIIFRLVQGVGGAFLMANSAAILTDAFPSNQRGMALGINNIVGVSGMFIGLVLGGMLAPIDWRLVFLISVPVGLFGTVWAYLKLRELSTPRRARIDWPGNLTFAVGLILSWSRSPTGSGPTDTTRPAGRARGCWSCSAPGSLSLVAFAMHRAARARPDVPAVAAADPGVHVRDAVDFPGGARPRRADVHADHLAAGDLAARSTASTSTDTPLRAGLFMLPLTVGMLVAGPTSGYLSDRYGARGFATGGMIAAALSFVLLWLLPIDFAYPVFALILLLNGISMGLFAVARTAPP